MNNKAKELALFFLRDAGCSDTATEKQITDAIEKTILIHPDTDREELKRHLESEYKIWVDDFRIIEKRSPKALGLLQTNLKLTGDFGKDTNGIWKKRKNSLRKLFNPLKN